jgi:hypothetical protein
MRRVGRGWLPPKKRSWLLLGTVFVLVLGIADPAQAAPGGHFTSLSVAGWRDLLRSPVWTRLPEQPGGARPHVPAGPVSGSKTRDRSCWPLGASRPATPALPRSPTTSRSITTRPGQRRVRRGTGRGADVGSRPRVVQVHRRGARVVALPVRERRELQMADRLGVSAARRRARTPPPGCATSAACRSRRPTRTATPPTTPTTKPASRPSPSHPRSAPKHRVGRRAGAAGHHRRLRHFRRRNPVGRPGRQRHQHRLRRRRQHGLANPAELHPTRRLHPDHRDHGLGLRQRESAAVRAGPADPHHGVHLRPDG